LRCVSTMVPCRSWFLPPVRRKKMTKLNTNVCQSNKNKP
jgi:hypothetical protein